MSSEDEDIRTASQGLTLEAIATLSNGGLHGVKGRKSMKQIGILYDQLLASGMEAEAAAAGLRAAGVSEDIIADLTGQKRRDQAETGGEKIAQAFIAGIASFLRSEVAERRVHDAANAATSGIRGQSPPKTGPLRFIGEWGENIADAWIDPLADRLAAGAGRVAGALSGYRSAFGLTPGAIGAAGSMAAMGAAGSGMLVNVGGINVSVTVDGGGDPEAIGSAVASKVHAAIDDVFATAERNVRLRWSAGEAI